MAALSRMATDTHRKIAITPKDLIIFSSHPIPGNEKPVTKTINALLAKGAEVIFQDAHVSGHACQEEIKLIYTLVNPKYAIPVHGEYKHRIAQAKLATELGMQEDNVFILSSGDILEVNEEAAVINGKVPAGGVLVDGLGVGDVGNVVLRDRQILSENGIMIVVMAIDGTTGMIVSGPEIVTRGFIYVRESDDLMEELENLLQDTVDDLMNKGITEFPRIRSTVRDALSDYVWKKMNRRPMIMPIIMEV